MQASFSETLSRHISKNGLLGTLGKHVTKDDTLLKKDSHKAFTSLVVLREITICFFGAAHRSPSCQLLVKLSILLVVSLVFADVNKSSDGSLFIVPQSPAVFPKYHPIGISKANYPVHCDVSKLT